VIIDANNADIHRSRESLTTNDVHSPMVLTCSPFQRRYKEFRLEACWMLMPDFKELVAQSWEAPVSSTNKAHVPHIKLVRLAKALKRDGTSKGSLLASKNRLRHIISVTDGSAARSTTTYRSGNSDTQGGKKQDHRNCSDAENQATTTFMTNMDLCWRCQH
jgi:hypothetical protein